MPQNSRIFEKWLASGEGMQVSAAHADSMHAHECLAPRLHRRRSIIRRKAAGFFERDREHAAELRRLSAATTTSIAPVLRIGLTRGPDSGHSGRSRNRVNI